MMRAIFLFFLLAYIPLVGAVTLGVDRFFTDGFVEKIKDKRVGLITNQTGIDSKMRLTSERLRDYPLVCLFCPEHGLKGQHYAFDKIEHQKEKGIPVFSLHGETRRPTREMLERIDVLIFDMQTTGVRSYTYEATLFYAMEEAAKYNIEVIVLDRPNPINGITVDGPMLEEKFRSFVGYINVPYCHGMTIGEIATFFNEEYKVGCKLSVVPMKGWDRSMSFRDTGLSWIPTSPNMPEADTPLFYPMTGIMGELSLLNIGIGFTLPFKIVGAPWIKGEEFAAKLNSQNLPGVHFQSFHFRPFWGLHKGQDCEGVMIQITNTKTYKPLSSLYMMMGMLKSLYPKEFMERLENKSNKDLFFKTNGTDQVYEILSKEKFPAWKLIELHQKERQLFLEKRKKYLIYGY